MADKKSKENELERVYNIPLRREFLKVPKYKRSKKAVKAVREFLSRHMKSDEVIIDNSINMALWHNGGENPPHHIKVVAKKDNEGKVRAELFGAKKKESKKEGKPKKEETEEVKEIKQENNSEASQDSEKE
ncbi:MAG: large subunit ribosomal protein L31e [Candidatus Woesearchaeota archaeon]|nr:large subunit ribosomal protein L31e [Candidatus Woesearchaeota archaeon]